jgi:hypothetical protein
MCGDLTQPTPLATYRTAYDALTSVAKVQPGEDVVILGASGAVGAAATGHASLRSSHWASTEVAPAGCCLVPGLSASRGLVQKCVQTTDVSPASTVRQPTVASRVSLVALIPRGSPPFDERVSTRVTRFPRRQKIHQGQPVAPQADLHYVGRTPFGSSCDEAKFVPSDLMGRVASVKVSTCSPAASDEWASLFMAIVPKHCV